MSIIIHIWTGEMPEKAPFNAIYGGNVEHVSITIIDLQNEEKPIYISHRPKDPKIDPRIDITNVNEVEKYLLKYLLKGYVPKSQSISLKKDCDLQKREPDIEMHMSSSYLNIPRMILYSEKYLQNELSESECLYHIDKNNSSSVVVNLIRQGLNCPNMKKTCGICNRSSNQKCTVIILWLLRIFVIFGVLVSSSFLFFLLDDGNLPIKIQNILIISFIILPALLVLWGFSWFYNIEICVIGLIPSWNIWSSISLQILIERINKIMEKEKHKTCPRTRKGIFNF
ncbi:hypothetical protein [Moorena sp. SIO3B2]|uniref:hypothetical protein n=1 Tax=Moorena sp. SIO3B2 TaxID=2607827 RepID=UPI0013CC857E|nr:hypothetical protein [Moorena sp. SIO3B2]NEP36720.1 hypothetical protein [Moorena sp. SIO3B2]